MQEMRHGPTVESAIDDVLRLIGHVLLVEDDVVVWFERQEKNRPCCERRRGRDDRKQ
jgi:hypothetical protein